MQSGTGAEFTPKLLTVLREGYGWQRLRADLLAGLTVAVVALPLAMALGIASGATPSQGLVTAIVAGFLISSFGGSRVQVGGPTGAFVVVISGVIASHGYAGLVLATAIAGIILIVAGYAGLGKLMRFVPMPVITGFTAGIAVIIASGQIGDFLGLHLVHAPADIAGRWAAYWEARYTLLPAAALTGGASLAGILLCRRLKPELPAYLIAIVMASGLVALFHVPAETVGARFTDMPHGLPVPHMPVFTLQMARDVLPSALTIAFLAGIEALLSAVVADGMTGYRHRSGQELVGQGIANIASAAFGGLPATGAIARTATNIRAGAQTPMAGMFHAAFLLVFLVTAGPLVAYIPMAALAAILLLVAWGMSEFDRIREIGQMDGGERVLLLLTFGLTIFVDLTVAIGVGVTLASLLFAARMVETVDISASGDGNEDPKQRMNLPSGVEVVRIAGPMFFGVAGETLETLARIGHKPKSIIVRMDRVPYIDASGVDVLAKFVERATARGAKIILCDMQKTVRARIERASTHFPDVRFAGDFIEAVDAAFDPLEEGKWK